MSHPPRPRIRGRGIGGPGQLGGRGGGVTSQGEITMRAKARESKSTRVLIDLGSTRAALIRLAVADAVGTGSPPNMSRMIRRLIAREDLRRRSVLRESPDDPRPPAAIVPSLVILG